MRKFTKEISALLASVTAGAMAGACVFAVSPDENGVSAESAPDEVMDTPTAGAPMPPDYFTQETKVTVVLGVDMRFETDDLEHTPEIGVAVPSDDIISTTVAENTPEMGVATLPDDIISTTTAENTPEMGVAAPPDAMTTTMIDEEIPPFMGEPMASDELITTVPVTTIPEITDCPDITMEKEIEIMGDMAPAFGDVDGNGIADVTDLSLISLHLIGDKEIKDPNALYQADIDYDGDVTLADMARLKQVLSKQKE